MVFVQPKAGGMTTAHFNAELIRWTVHLETCSVLRFGEHMATTLIEARPMFSDGMHSASWISTTQSPLRKMRYWAVSVKVATGCPSAY
jgi:hypothetical protein